MARYKKKTSFLGGFLKFIFWLILILALIFGGAWAYFYFAKNVDLVGAIGQMSSLAQNVDENEITADAIDDEDLTNIETKTNISVFQGNIMLLGNELGAYINKSIYENNISTSLLGMEVDLSEWNLEVLEMSFVNPAKTEGHFADITTVLKFETTNLKQELNTFPVSLLKSMLPNVLYLTLTVSVNESDTANFESQFLSLQINNLSVAETKNLLEGIKIFTGEFDEKELLMLIDMFLAEILGTSTQDGLVQKLSTVAPTGYEANFGFTQQNNETYFTITCDPALYDVQVCQKLGDNYNVNVAEITGAGEIYLYGENATLMIVPKTGYTFVGWYNGTQLLSTDTTYVLNNIVSDTTLYAEFAYITKTITYNNTKDADNPNPVTYNISNGVFSLMNITSNGYKFCGWYTAENGQGTKVSSIDASQLVDYTLFAHWTLQTYSIFYNLNGGTLSDANPSNYTIETPTFTLSNPTKTDTEFTGWTGTNLSATTLSVNIPQGSYGDLVFSAHYLNDTTVFLYIDGQLKDSFYMSYGEYVDETVIKNYGDIGQYTNGAYTVQNWYTDITMTTPFSPTQITEDISLYSTLEYFTDKLLFYPYLQEFNSAVQNNTRMTFDTQDKLVAWIDYVVFYRVFYQTSGNPTFDLTYMPNTTNEQKKAEVENAYYNVYATRTKFQTTQYAITYASEGFFISPDLTRTDPLSNMASLTADPNHTQTLPQQDSALMIKNTSPRSSNFNNFKIEQITKTVSVSNSEQLVHVLEQGYKPICQTGSMAETIYNSAKAVLRQICNDTMTDVQKLQAIYEWLVLNVQYDHKAADEITNADLTRHYRCWFAEGVFLDKVAVCEGFAKATVILSRIENIPAVVVTNYNHAWNKVFVDGKWYGFDATHGNLGASGMEVLSYAAFLFPDTHRPSIVATEYPDQIANTVYNYYENTKITYQNQTFDLVVNSYSEMTQILEYVASNLPQNITSTYYTIELATTSPGFETYLSQALNTINLDFYSHLTQTDASGQTVYLLVFNK